MNLNAKPHESTFDELRKELPDQTERLIRLHLPHSEWFVKKMCLENQYIPDVCDFEILFYELLVHDFNTEEFSRGVTVITAKIKAQAKLTVLLDREKLSSHHLNFNISVIILGKYFPKQSNFWYHTENILIGNFVCSEIRGKPFINKNATILPAPSSLTQ